MITTSNHHSHSIKAILDRHMVSVVEVQGLMLVVTQDLLEEAQDLMAVEAQDLMVVEAQDLMVMEEGFTVGEQGLMVVAEGKDLEV